MRVTATMAVAVLVASGGCGSGGHKPVSSIAPLTERTTTSVTVAPTITEPPPAVTTEALPTPAAGSSSPTTLARRAPSSSVTTPRAPSATTIAPSTTARPASTTTRPPAKAAISIKTYMFSPNPLRVAVGTTVTATNDEATAIPHTWTSDTGAWDSKQLEPGQSYSHTFTTAGTYSYHCNIHSFMTGQVIVG